MDIGGEGGFHQRAVVAGLGAPEAVFEGGEVGGSGGWPPNPDPSRAGGGEALFALWWGWDGSSGVRGGTRVDWSETGG